MRKGTNPAAKLDLPVLLRLFQDCYQDFSQRDYFQEALGYTCVDAGEVSGTLGANIEAQVFRRLRKPNLWPVKNRAPTYSEDDLFDVIEFLFDVVSKPVEGYYHQFNACGWHYNVFDQKAGREEFRTEMNGLLQDYGPGYELSDDGEILAVADRGLGSLLEAPVPKDDPENVEQRVQAAMLKFRRHHSSLDDRRTQSETLPMCWNT